MAPPGGQQQSASDNSLDMLWICAALCVGVLLLWYFFHTQIVVGFLTFKLWEASLVELFTHKITPLKQVVQGVDPKNVTFTQLIAVATEVGKYLRYPLCAILIVMAIRVYQRSATTRFCQVFNMKSLLRQELSNWPYAQIVMNKDLVKEDIFTGPWAMSMTAMQFSRKYKLLDVEKKQMGATGLARDMGYEAKVNKYRAHKVFVKQLGELWRSIDELQPHRRALFAIFAAKAMGDRQSADKLLRQIALSAVSSSLDLSGVDTLLKKHKNEKIFQEIINRHAFEYGVLAGMLELARADGVLASAEFLWLKPCDRTLWYVLNSVGRQTVFPEVAGIFAHFLAEKTIGYRLVSPMVEEAITGLEEAIDEFVYVPSDEEKARLG